MSMLTIEGMGGNSESERSDSDIVHGESDRATESIEN